MNMYLEPATEPAVRVDQDKINRYYDMVEGQTAIEMFLADYKKLFPQEIDAFLFDLSLAVQDETEEQDESF
ncbi:hypothetical protein RWV98_02805 [Agathobaculum sp. NTUH-O15-33]|uniref:hypothetical protein n=1 Tax=Agathobaculum sp. NTUH-O15-33 TaxID=3079302 RepID=UPI0029584639|nr:hypothetical protein [Agathobaculum sp. NTUH-O15-33]WNX85222.1 hypothetical protein RWV98_02805 [Agathobaculum sp. NTUH-O15-33]